MKLLRNVFKRIVLIIIMLSLLITFLATPTSYAELNLKDGDFYYTGTTKGTYAASTNIFAWLINNLGEIIDWLMGIITFGVRIVFVGWTALFEKILTWTLEMSTGIRVDGLESSTDLSSVTDSGNNVTVEAIVYNRVPALSADIFDLEYDRTHTGTGRKLVCEDCGQDVEVCKGVVFKDFDATKTYSCVGKKEPEKEGETARNCECNGCDDCETYLAQLKIEEPTILKLRQLVSTWYYLIRLLAMAAMLVVLIAVGIKMALSTIASDKAVYKRMLVDWVVGVIMIFALHYFMIFVINMNSVLVKVIEESAQSINKVSMMQISGEEKEIANTEIELKVYEEVRTRAYDPKLMNGLIGMVMYMTLVFLAFKYTIIYVKRLLTIMVLTLMAPGVGVAYALQKVISGKSSALKTWMTEYIMNIIVQIVHALLYAVFISQALVLSLQSISGMVIALILMNYSTKADVLFKKIFKFGGGDSLVGHTENALESSIQGLQSAKGLVTGAKPLAKVLTNTPYAKALKGAGKLAVAGVVGGVGAGVTAIGDAVDRRREKKEAEAEEAIGMDPIEGSETGLEKGETLDDVIAQIRTTGTISNEKEERVPAGQNVIDKALLNTDPKVLGAELRQAQEEFEKAYSKDKESEDTTEKKEKMQRAYNNTRRYAKLTQATQGKIALGHARKALEIRNEYKLRHKGNKSPHPVLGAMGEGLKATFGTVSWDSRNWKLTSDKSKAIYKRFNAENLLGFTPEDKKQFKEHVWTPMAQTFIGMGSLFVGMSTVVMNPKLGMGLLATGVNYTSKNLRRPRGVKSDGRYTFSRYGTLTMNAIKNSAIQEARRERRGLTAAHLTKTRPSFVQNLKDGKLSAITLSVAFAPVTATALAAHAIAHPVNSTAAVVNTIRNYKEIPGNIKGYFGKIGENTKAIPGNVATSISEAGTKIKNTVEDPKEALKDVGLAAGERIVDGMKLGNDLVLGRFIATTSFADHLEALDNHSMIQQRKQEKEFKEDATKLMAVQSKALFELEQKALDDKATIEIYKSLGYKYDPKTGIATLIEEEKVSKKLSTESDIKAEEFNELNGKALNQTEIDTINREIDRAILELAQSGSIDMNSKKSQRDAIKHIEDKLRKMGILEESMTLGSVLKDGESGLIKTLKNKSESANGSMKEAKTAFDQTDQTMAENQTTIISTVSELLKERSKLGDGSKPITFDDVKARWNDGSKAVSTSDGSSRVDTGNPPNFNQKQIEQIENYISAATAAPTSTPKVDLTTVRRKAEKEKEDRNKKLQQVLAIAMDLEGTVSTPDVSGEQKTSEEVLEQLLTKKGEAKTIAGISLSEDESAAATAMLQSLLEMKATNEIAVKDLKMKKGTSAFNNATNERKMLEREILVEKDATKVTSHREKLDGVSKKLDSHSIGPVADITSIIKKMDSEKKGDK